MSHTPADPALPALQELLPDTGAPEVVAEIVGELSGVEADRPGDLRYVRYHPGRSCVLLWSFGLLNGRPLLVSGTLFAGDRGSKIVGDGAFRRLAAEASTVAGVAESYRYLPGRRLLVQLFPLDVNLRGLPVAASAERVAPALADTGALDVCTDAAEPMLLSYKPWRRCVLRYQLRHSRGGGYVGKVYRDDRGKTVLERLQVVHADLAAAGAPWIPVTPATYLPEPHLLLLEAVPDAAGLRHLFETAVGDGQIRETLLAHVRRTAAGLLPFRNVGVARLDHVTPTVILDRLEDRRRSVEGIAPGFANAALRCLRRLEDSAARLPAEPLCLAHGAFRHNQLLVAGERLVLADPDGFCHAGPALDPGEFLACLDRNALRRPHLRGVMADCEGAFLGGLETDDQVSTGWLAWHRAASHVKLAVRSVFSLAPAWPDTVDGLLRLAGATIARVSDGTVSVR